MGDPNGSWDFVCACALPSLKPDCCLTRNPATSRLHPAAPSRDALSHRDGTSPPALLAPTTPAVHHRLRDVGHAQRFSVQRHPAAHGSLGVLARRLAGERRRVEHRLQAGVVGGFRRSWQIHRHRPVLCDLHERPWRVFRLDRTVQPLPPRREQCSLGNEIPPAQHPRHDARAVESAG